MVETTVTNYTPALPYAVASFDVTYGADLPTPNVVVDDDAAWRRTHGLNAANGYDNHAPETKEWR